MLAQNLVDTSIAPLSLEDSPLKAMNLMDEYKVNHLPIVDGNNFEGLVSDEELLDLNMSETESTFRLLDKKWGRPFITGAQHLFDVIRLTSDLQLSVLPVLNENEHYIGLITLPTIIQHLSQISSVTEPGGVIVLEVNVNDFSFSQIAQIIEGNDTKILSSYVSPHRDSTKIEVTIKTNREDLSGILQTFNRYNYTVKATFHQSKHNDDLKRYYDGFMNYLRM